MYIIDLHIFQVWKDNNLLYKFVKDYSKPNENYLESMQRQQVVMLTQSKQEMLSFIIDTISNPASDYVSISFLHMIDLNIIDWVKIFNALSTTKNITSLYVGDARMLTDKIDITMIKNILNGNTTFKEISCSHTPFVLY